MNQPPQGVPVTDPVRPRIEDSTLGIELAPTPAAERAPPHRLVAVGDSLTHGFKSLAVRHTNLSYPAMLAHELGWKEYRYPIYRGPGGLPLDLEWLLRGLEAKFGESLNVLETVGTVLTARRMLEENEDYWERGLGARPPRGVGINHNLAVYGWDLRDALSRDAQMCRDDMKPAHDDLWPSLPQNANDLAALYVLDDARSPAGHALSSLEAAAVLGAEGVETLIVFLGANNALGTVLTLEVSWSGQDYDDPWKKRQYNLWKPEHFQAELREVIAAVRRVRARHVLCLTIPHVTIAPIAKGVGGKVTPGSRYFKFYTRPWVREDAFDEKPDRYPALTADEARDIDNAIDKYNDFIVEAVRAARTDGLDWHLIDIAGVLDGLASRRFLEDPDAAQRDGWKPYVLPKGLTDALDFTPTTRFLNSGKDGISQGGLVALDGVHPTTTGYSIIAHECMKAMVRAGVRFYGRDGQPREDPELDFARVIAKDTLLQDPLLSLTRDLNLLGSLDDRFALIAGAERSLRRRKPKR